MLEKILACSRKQNKSELELLPSPKLAASVDLPAITIFPSRYLWRMQCAVYSAMLAFAFIALFPFFLAAFYWVLVWLTFAVFVGIAIRKSWRAKCAEPVQLEIKLDNWQLKTRKGEFAVAPGHTLLLWSWVIVIPLREMFSRNQHYLIVLPDSLAKEDWRRLRVWLMTCF